VADRPNSATDDGGEALTRVCEQCGKSIRLKAKYTGLAVRCPVCGAGVKPKAGEGVHSIEYLERDNRLASATGWTASVALHASLLLLFTGVTWLSGFSTGGGEAEVGIVTDDKGPAIKPGDAELLQIKTAMSPLNTLAIQESVQVEPVTDLGASSGTSQKEAIIGIELAGGASGAAMEGDWSSFAGSGGAQGAGKASFFGIEAQGGRFVYVVDRSGSMSGPKLQAAKEELIRSITALEHTMEFYIIFYDSRSFTMHAPGMVPATERNRQKHLGWVQEIGPGGGTDPTDAMKTALALEPDAVWLLSDGLFHEQVCGVIRSANPGARVQIHTIAFYDDAGEPVLRRIAEENRGTYRFVSPANLGWPAPGRSPMPWPRR